MTSKIYLTRIASKWLKRKDGSTLVVKVIPNFKHEDEFPESGLLEYLLYQDDFGMFDLYFSNPSPEIRVPGEVYLGRILFDSQHNWVYDGGALNVFEEEQLGEFICSCEHV